MNITALLNKAVRNFRGPEPEDSNGAAGLAPAMGITSTSLSHKVSPTYPTAHCSPEEVVRICELTGDHEAVRAMAHKLGYALIPMVQTDGGQAIDLSLLMAGSFEEFGDFMSDFSRRVADKNVCDNDMASIDKKFMESIGAKCAMYAHARAMHLAGKTKEGSAA